MPRLALAAAVLVLIAPSAARAQASGPVSLTGDVTSVFRPQAAFTQHGEAVVAYGADGHFAWSWAPPGSDGPFTTQVTSTTDVAARALTYASNRVLVVSRTQSRLPWELRARFGGVTSGLGRVHRLAPSEDVLTYSAAVDERGDAVVGYVQNVRRGAVVRRRVVRVVRRSAGGRFGRPETIAGRGSPTAVAAAVGRDGEVLVAYERAGRVEVRTRRPGHRWGAAQILGAAVDGHTQLAAAGASTGRFVVAWFAQELTEGGEHGPGVVRGALRRATRAPLAFQHAGTLETFAERAPEGVAVHIALGPDGTGVVGWTGREDGQWVPRVGELVDDLGSCSGPRPCPELTHSGPSGQLLGDVAAGNRRAAAFVSLPPLDTPSPQIFLSVREPWPGGDAPLPPFGESQPVGPPAREVAAPMVALEPDASRALVAWVQRTGERTQAVLAAFRGGS